MEGKSEGATAMSNGIPDTLSALLGNDAASPDRVLDDFVGAYARAICADRCVLFLYRPERRLCRRTHAWQARPDWELPRFATGWTTLPEDLAEQDPLYAMALENPEAMYIDDIESADPALVDAEYERENYGHRSLIHAPLYDRDVMLGVLEPCTIAAPKVWTAADREITRWSQAALLPVIKAYLIS